MFFQTTSPAEMVEHYRIAYASALLPTDLAFWMNWINDKAHPSIFEDFENICKQALRDCPHHSIAMAYIRRAVEEQEQGRLVRNILSVLIPTVGVKLTINRSCEIINIVKSNKYCCLLTNSVTRNSKLFYIFFFLWLNLYGHQSQSDLRALFEKLLVACGSDIFTSIELWELYRDFEIEEHELLLDAFSGQQLQTDGTNEGNITQQMLQKSKERFIKLYHRQLSLPLVGNEKTLQNMSQKLEIFCSSSDESLIDPVALQAKYKQGLELREARLTFEMHIHSETYTKADTEKKLLSWQSYIDFEIKKSQLSRAQRLYERALLDSSCSAVLQLWLDFTQFALVTLKNRPLLLSVTDRALRRRAEHRKVSLLWRLKLLALEFTGAELADLSKVYQEALQGGFANVEEYLDIYYAYCDGCRRKVLTAQADLQGISPTLAPTPPSTSGSWSGNERGGAPISDDPVIEDPVRIAVLNNLVRPAVYCLKTALQQIAQFLTTYCAEWTTGWWKLCKYQSFLERSLNLSQICRELEDAAAATTNDDVAIAVDDCKIIMGDSLTGHVTKSKRTKSAARSPQGIQGAAVWEDACQRFPSSWFMWNEYLNWLKAVGEYEMCRKTFRRLQHSSSLDIGAAELYREWIAFEQLHGDVNTIQEAFLRGFAQLKPTGTDLTTSEQQQCSMQEQTTTSTSPSSASASAGQTTVRNNSQSGTSQKRKRDADADPGADSVSGHRERVEPVHIKPRSASQHTLTILAPASSIDGTRKKIVEEQEELTAKRVKFAKSEARVSTSSVASTTSAAVDAPAMEITAPVANTVLQISNFPFTSSMDCIRPFLDMKCPGIKSAELALSKAGKSRGLVRIAFDSSEQLQNAAYAIQGALFNDRALKAEVVPDPLIARQQKQQQQQQPQKKKKPEAEAGSAATPHLTTVFVSGFGAEVTSAQLREHFTQLKCNSTGAGDLEGGGRGSGAGASASDGRAAGVDSAGNDSIDGGGVSVFHQIIAARVAVDKKTGQSKVSHRLDYTRTYDDSLVEF